MILQVDSGGTLALMQQMVNLKELGSSPPTADGSLSASNPFANSNFLSKSPSQNNSIHSPNIFNPQSSPIEQISPPVQPQNSPSLHPNSSQTENVSPDTKQAAPPYSYDIEDTPMT